MVYIKLSMELVKLVLITLMIFIIGCLIPSATSICSLCFYSLLSIALGYAAVVMHPRFVFNIEYVKRKLRFTRGIYKNLEIWG